MLMIKNAAAKMLLCVVLICFLSGCGTDNPGGGGKTSAAGTGAGDSVTAEAAESSEKGETGAAEAASADSGKKGDTKGTGSNRTGSAENTEKDGADGQDADQIEIPENPYFREDGGVSINVFAMDTYMTLLAYGDRAEEAVLAAAKEIHSLDDRLSTGNPDSEISRLNASGGGMASELVRYLVAQSLELYKETGGLFDIAIYPVMKLWGFPTQEYHVPEKAQLEEALKLVDASAITVSTPATATDIPLAETASTAEKSFATKTSIRETASTGGTSPATAAPFTETASTGETSAAELPAENASASESTSAENASASESVSAGNASARESASAENASASESTSAENASAQETASGEEAEIRFWIPGMEIDLGGIAKGYTGNRVMEIFREYGIERGLISLGGNVQALGAKDDSGKAWRIAIQNPQGSQDYLGVLDVKDKAVVTSGGYERYFEQDGVRYHHIIDPRTGYPADSGLVSVTILSEDGTLADGLSTSLFIMGKEGAEKLWRAHADRFDYIIEDTSGALYVTEGAKDLLTTNHRTVIITR